MITMFLIKYPQFLKTIAVFKMLPNMNMSYELEYVLVFALRSEGACNNMKNERINENFVPYVDIAEQWIKS